MNLTIDRTIDLIAFLALALNLSFDLIPNSLVIVILVFYVSWKLLNIVRNIVYERRLRRKLEVLKKHPYVLALKELCDKVEREKK